MEVLNEGEEKVEPLKINFKFWGWFHAAVYMVGIVFFLGANGRMWERLSDRALYDVMMQVGSLAYLLIWGLAFLKIRRVRLAFLFSSLSIFCLGVSGGAMLKSVFIP